MTALARTVPRAHARFPEETTSRRHVLGLVPGQSCPAWRSGDTRGILPTWRLDCHLRIRATHVRLHAQLQGAAEYVVFGDGSYAHREYQDWMPRRAPSQIFLGQTVCDNQQEWLSDHAPSMVGRSELESKSTDPRLTVRKPYVRVPTSRLHVGHLNRLNNASGWESIRNLCPSKQCTNSRHAVFDVRCSSVRIAQAFCRGHNEVPTQSSRIFTRKCQIRRQRGLADLILYIVATVRYCESHDSENW